MPRASGWSGLVALLLLGVGQQAHAQDAPIAFEGCQPTMFISQGQQGTTTPIYTIGTGTNPFTFSQFTSGVYRHNALGYHPTHHFLYSITVDGLANNPVNHLIRFGSNAVPQDMGPVSGLSTNQNYNSGTFGNDGTYYVRYAGSNNQLYRIDIDSMTATSITMTGGNVGGTINASDMAYIGGMIYTITNSTNQLFQINASTGVLSPIGLPQNTGANFGAMFVAENGLFASSNGGGFYQVDMDTGALTLISDSPASSNNDGAKCQNALIEFGADLSVTKTNTPNGGPNDQPNDTYVPGEERTYTIVVSNSGPFGAAGVTVRDPLPAGITEATWTCSGTNGGNGVGTCTASGTGEINDAHVGLPVDATVTYLLTLTVPLDFTGDLRNTVTVSPGPTTSDPNHDNNTAEDVDQSVPVADLWVTKTNSYDALQTGAQTTYDIVFGNNGPDDVENALLFDRPEYGLTDCELATPACGVASGTATCPEVGEESGQLSMPNLASASVAVPLMEANSSILVRITCTVQ